MATLLKDWYSISFYDNFSLILQEVLPTFDAPKFKALIFSDNWEQKALKERMRHTTQVLHQFMPKDFALSSQYIITITNILLTKGNADKKAGVQYLFLPDYIELYGMAHFDIAVQTMELVTTFVSCEFPIRPFIVKYPQQAMKQMQQWASHTNYKVRRLASEGCRPRLPWAMALPTLKKDPSPILPILQQLKNDPTDFVRRSVANNLNDIAKDHPEQVLAIAEDWYGNNELTNWVVKHACRTLLKQGNTRAMQLFGFSSIEKVTVSNFMVETPFIKVGDYLSFSFNLQNNNSTPTKLRIEYGLYYLKANGCLARKVFMLSEKTYLANNSYFLQKKQSFKMISTRKFYLGEHQVSLIINGIELPDRLVFDLQASKKN